MRGQTQQSLDAEPTDGIKGDALSDRANRRVLSACIQRARSVRDIERETGLAPASAYRHVRCVLRAGLLRVERNAITCDGKRYDLFRAAAPSMRLVVDAGGTRVASAPADAAEDSRGTAIPSIRVQ